MKNFRKSMLIACTIGAMSSGNANAQSLFLAQTEIVTEAASATPTLYVEQVSLAYVEPPEPREIKQYDIITIIIDEVSSTTSSQTLETEKVNKTKQTLNSLIDAMALLELQLASSSITNLGLVDLNAKNTYTGEGDYERKDKFTARITAQVLEIKPNGTLVLEAVKRIAKDEEIQTLVLSGVAREEDITLQNTILSSQLANLNLVLENEGELKDTAEKGLITKVLDAVFAI